MTHPKIGYIGLGGMGSNMVRRLSSSGFRVRAYDIDRERAVSSVGGMAEVVGDITEVVEGVDVVCTSLPDPAAVHTVYLDSDGIIPAAESGTALLDFSTVDPLTSRKVAGCAAGAGLPFFDCPVSGGPREAAAGELIVFLGGDPQRLSTVRPILETLAKTIHHIGESGSGATVKMVNNMIANGTVLLTAEAFVLGIRLGLDPDRLFEVLMTAGARSHHFEKRFPHALDGNFDPGYKLALARKDMALALDMGRALKMPLSVTAIIHELYSAAGAQGFDDQDYVSIIKYFENLAGVEARSSRSGEEMNSARGE